MTRGWWRTNRAWLAALVAALGLLGLVTWRAEAVQAWWTTQPHRAAVADADGWATVGDVSYRLVGLEEVGALDDGFGGTVEAPDGYALLAADLSARSQDRPPGSEAEPSSSCASELQDTAGRTYAAGASALDGVPFPEPLTCAGPVSARVTQYFLVPDGAVPSEVRVVDRTLLPAYWSLPVPATG